MILKKKKKNIHTHNGTEYGYEKLNENRVKKTRTLNSHGIVNQSLMSVKI